MSAQNIISKQYNFKIKNKNMMMYSLIKTFFALLFFVVYSGGNLNFCTEIIPYAIGFGITYAAGTVANEYAVKTGSLSITSLVISYSLIIPTLYGTVFLNEPVRISTYTGIALLMISLFLVNMKKENTKFAFAWIVWIVIAFCGNGLCLSIQKLQQLKFNGAYKNEFMIAALLFVNTVLFVIVTLQKGDKGFKDCLKYASLNGVANGLANMFTMFLVGLMPGAVLYPSITAGSMIVTFVISLAVYKEKLAKMQLTGYAVGVLSVIILNI